jgi:LPS export ABC transporter protein LptC
VTHAFRFALCSLASAALACGDTNAPPVASQALLPDSAEQLLIGVSFFLTDAGIRRANVRADTMVMYDDNTREQLFKVTATFFTPEGVQDAVLTAAQGAHNSRLGTMEARGNVVVVSKEGEKLESPHLKYDPSRNEISSDSAFTLTQGERVTKGVGFVSSPDMSNMRILAAAQVTGTQVKIPKR